MGVEVDDDDEDDGDKESSQADGTLILSPRRIFHIPGQDQLISVVTNSPQK